MNWGLNPPNPTPTPDNLIADDRQKRETDRHSEERVKARDKRTERVS